MRKTLFEMVREYARDHRDELIQKAIAVGGGLIGLIGMTILGSGKKSEPEVETETITIEGEHGDIHITKF